MPLDPVIAQGITPINFAGPDPATKMNQLAVMMKMQGLQSEGQLNALKLTEAQGEMADVEAMREAIRTGADFRDPKVASRYGAKGLATSKALIDADSADLDRKTKIATVSRDIWSRINDQTSYEAALPELEALRPGSVANLPRVFDRKMVAENVMDAKTFLDQYKPQTELSKLIAARDSLSPGDPNRATYDAAITKATTREPGTSVNVSTGKEYGSQFGEEVAKSDTALLSSARSAPVMAQNAVDTLKILKQGNLITGTGAQFRLGLAKALNLAGGTDAEKIANTEALVSGQAASVLSSIKTSELGGGKTFTDNDLKFLERAKGGTLEMSVQQLTRLAELQYKASQIAIETWTNRRKNIPASVISQTGLGNEEYELPSTDANVPANAKQAPDGNYYIPDPNRPGKYLQVMP